MLSALLSVVVVVVVVVVVSVGDFSPTGVMLSVVVSLKCSLYTPLRGFIHCKLVI